jgi:hypothetical protein
MTSTDDQFEIVFSPQAQEDLLGVSRQPVCF